MDMRRLWRPGWLGLIGLGACTQLWESGNGMFLGRDLDSLLEGQGVAVSLSDCHLVGRSREGLCLATLRPQEAELLRDRLALVPLDEKDRLSPGGCAAMPAFGDNSPAQRLKATAERSRLRLPNRTQFDRFYLYYRADTGESCLEVAYAYG